MYDFFQKPNHSNVFQKQLLKNVIFFVSDLLYLWGINKQQHKFLLNNQKHKL